MCISTETLEFATRGKLLNVSLNACSTKLTCKAVTLEACQTKYAARVDRKLHYPYKIWYCGAIRACLGGRLCVVCGCVWLCVSVCLGGDLRVFGGACLFVCVCVSLCMELCVCGGLGVAYVWRSGGSPKCMR